MSQCPDIHQASSGCFSSESTIQAPLRKGRNIWLVAAEKPAPGQSIVKNVGTALDHFVGDGWSGALIVKTEKSFSTSQASKDAVAHLNFPLPPFKSPMVYLTIEFNYDGRKPSVHWPWLQCTFKQICIGLIAALKLPKSADMSDEDKARAEYFESVRATRASKGLGLIEPEKKTDTSLMILPALGVAAVAFWAWRRK